LDNSQHYFSLSKHLICVYRDLIEAGKPQLLIRIPTSLKADEIKTIFNKKLKELKKNEKMIVDGKRLIDLNVFDIRLSLNSISAEHNNKRKEYASIPFVIASVALTIDTIKKAKEN